MDTQPITLDIRKLANFQSSKPFRLWVSNRKPPKDAAQFSMLAHEVRNPLATIDLAVQILKSPAKVYDPQLYLDIIHRATGQINDLIADLLKSSQNGESPDSGEGRPEEYPIHQLLDQSLAMASDRILLKNILVRKDYTTVDCNIFVNKQEMRHAIANIIVNAVDAMSENGKLKLTAKSINGKCVVEIEDNGVGISKRNLKNIFKPYFTDKPGGLGLGLSTTMVILKANHATADVHSIEGKGTRFVLTFGRNRS